MKRPFLFTGVIALILSSLALLLKKEVIIAAIFTVITLFLLYLKFKKKTKGNTNIPICIITILLVTISCLYTLNYVYSPIKNLLQEEANITATVVREPYQSGDYSYYTLNGNTENSSRNFSFEFVSDNLGINMGDRVNLRVRFTELKNPYRASMISEGIYINANVIEIHSVTEDYSPLYTAIRNLRLYIKTVIGRVADGDASGVMLALLSGNRSLMSDEIYSATKTCGVTHILVVSGLHLGILCGASAAFINKLKLGQKIGLFISFLLICLIICVCEFHTSAIRAAITTIITLLGHLGSRKADPLNSLGIAVTVMVLFNPFVAGNVAFLLSVFSTFGVVFLSSKLMLLCKPLRFSGKLGVIVNMGIDVFLISVSALIAVFPILVYYFGYISLLSPIVGVFINSAVTISLILSTVGVFLSAIPLASVISPVLLIASKLITKYIIFIINIFAHFGDALILQLGKNSYIVCFILSALTIIFITILYNKKMKERSKSNAT